MRERRRPHLDMLLIGAPKAGTTWLTRCLADHPDLFMPLQEIHYFSRHHRRGDSWYAAHFDGAAEHQQLAENSNSYLTEKPALARIAAEQPQAKIVCILRNPVDRAYSSYGMQVDRGRATSDIDRYLDPVRSPRPHILANGLYAKQLEPWYRAFPAEQIMIARYEDILSEPLTLYERTLRFLSLDASFVPARIHERENARKKTGAPAGLKRALWWSRPLLNTRPVQAWLKGPAGQKLQERIARPKRYPALTQDLRARLAEFYKTDIEDLGRLTGEDFSGWLAGYAALADERRMVPGDREIAQGSPA